MTDYGYDKNLPYVVVSYGKAARFEDFVHAEWFADFAESKIIDTTPKPRVPAGTRFITWLGRSGARWYAERRGGVWIADGGVGVGDMDLLPGVTPDTVFTVLDAREEER